MTNIWWLQRIYIKTCCKKILVFSSPRFRRLWELAFKSLPTVLGISLLTLTTFARRAETAQEKVYKTRGWIGLSLPDQQEYFTFKSYLQRLLQRERLTCLLLQAIIYDFFHQMIALLNQIFILPLHIAAVWYASLDIFSTTLLSACSCANTVLFSLLLSYLYIFPLILTKKWNPPLLLVAKRSNLLCLPAL